MRRIRNSERGNVLALSSLFTLALAMAGAALAEEPGKWLERMNQALTSRNYDGTFSHWQGGRVEMLRILHRVHNGAVSERLVSLDGSGREFIRTGANLACYLPDKRTVLVENRPAEESLLSGFPTINDQTASFYDLKEVAQTRLLGRDTHYITVTPKDEYRYGYRLWIDDKTAMPLKTQLCDTHGHVIEQIVFASLTLVLPHPRCRIQARSLHRRLPMAPQRQRADQGAGGRGDRGPGRLGGAQTSARIQDDRSARRRPCRARTLPWITWCSRMGWPLCLCLWNPR